MRGGVVGVALFAVAFAQAEDGRGGELAVLVELVGDGLVGLDGGAQVLVGLFLKQPALDGSGEVVGGGGDEGHGTQENPVNQKECLHCVHLNSFLV